MRKDSRPYSYGIEWIAFNDSYGDETAFQVNEVKDLTTVCLLADMFEVTPLRIAKDVVAVRKYERNPGKFKKDPLKELVKAKLRIP